MQRLLAVTSQQPGFSYLIAKQKKTNRKKKTPNHPKNPKQTNTNSPHPNINNNKLNEASFGAKNINQSDFTRQHSSPASLSIVLFQPLKWEDI